MLPSLEEVSTSPSSHIQPASCLYALACLLEALELEPLSRIFQEAPEYLLGGTLQVIPGTTLRLFQTWEMYGPIYKGEKNKNKK